MPKPLKNLKNTLNDYLGELPKHWGVSRLLNIEYVRGVTYSSLDEINGDNGHRILRANNISLNGGLNFDNIKTISFQSKVKETQKLKKDDIFMCVASGSMENLGKVAYIEKDLNYYFGAFMSVLRIHNKNISSKYIFYYLKSSNFREFLDLSTSSTTINNLNMETIKSLKIPLPPLKEQEKIAEYLDKKVSGIDKSLQTTKTLKEKLKSLKNALITECVTKGLDKHTTYQNTPIDYLKEIPKHWGVKKLKHVILSLTTGLNPRNYFTFDTPDATNFFITIHELKNGKITPNETTCKINNEALKLCNKRAKLEVNDILFSGKGTIGEVAVIDKEPKNWCINEAIYAIKPNLSLIAPYFLYYVLQSQVIKEQCFNNSFSNTITNLIMSNLKNFVLPLPPLKEQEKIAEYLDKEVSKIDTLSNTLSQLENTLKAFKKALISDCVLGKKEIK
ncbi:restriction endonuclease subunit S [Helicobacter cetorum]|uniref:Restriction modification system DNA specificity domain-containing protein n=1 Tax=Helicobacter cetorum (strain ATCC BAA-540 / CCUG 52418 / MIT 99-5656) TaxID=1163745 RepID=I0ESP2_HELCM|nr:restriction endonuclease subunit S [Helicobacter cetorum]AFI05961.1 restriction modification system DNA specificity domain-containing protein [Helicobacter cetorum MIT 99-5656]